MIEVTIVRAEELAADPLPEKCDNCHINPAAIMLIAEHDGELYEMRALCLECGSTISMKPQRRL